MLQNPNQLPISIHTIAGLAAILCLSLSVEGQIPSNLNYTVNNLTAQPRPGDGHDYIHDLNETVNPANGQVSIRIAAPMPHERALNFPIQAYFYDSNERRTFQMLQDIGFCGVSGVGWPGCSVAVTPPQWVTPSAFSGPSNPVGNTLLWTSSTGLFERAASQYEAYTYSSPGSYMDPSGNKHDLHMSFWGLVLPGDSYPGGGSYSCANFSEPPLDTGGTVIGGDGQYKALVFPPYTTSVGDVPSFSESAPQTSASLHASALSDAHGNIVFGGSPCNGCAYPEFTITEDTNGNFNNGTGRSGSYTGYVPYPNSVFGFDSNEKQVTSLPGFSDSNGQYTISFPGISTPYTYNFKTVASSYDPTVTDVSAGNNGGTPVYDNLCDNANPTNTQPYAAGVNPNSTTTEVQTISLPEDLSYQFTYDSVYGLVNQITYPTGATVTYTWGVNSNLGQTSPVEIMGFNVGTLGFGNIYAVPTAAWPNVPGSDGVYTTYCYFRHDLPAVQKRVVSLDGVHPALEEDFTYTTNYSTPTSLDWTTKSTTATTKDLLAPWSPVTSVTYNYTRDIIQNQVGTAYTSSKPTESSIVYQVSGQTLKTVNNVWAGNMQGVLTAECTTMPNVGTAGTFYQYERWPGGGIFNSIVEDAVTDVAEYDYGAINISGGCVQPSATPSRETKTTYASFPNTPFWPAVQVNGTNVANPYMLDRPATVQVYGNGTLLAETDYTYDQYSTYPLVAVSPAAIAHDETNYGPTSTWPRGNPTTITRKCFAGSQSCTNVAFHIQYDETGQPVEIQDGNGNWTALSYADNYTNDDGTPGSVPCVPDGSSTCSNTNTYVTQITRPTTANGVAHVEKFQWDFNKGELRVAWDENNNPSYYYYNDPWNRLNQSNFPDGGQVTNSYSDTGPSPSVTTTQLMLSSGLSKTTVQIMDALGHPVQTQLTSDPNGIIYADKYYDGLGQVYQTSTPYRSTSDPSYGLTNLKYDSLGRETSKTNPDGSVAQWCFNGSASLGQTNCRTHIANSVGEWVDNTDENGNSWQRTTNALGQLTSVVEPSSASQTPTMETDYGYDALNNLLGVTQWGGTSGSSGARTRSFIYNSLSQLLTAQNPESGTTNYTYDANGNLTQKVSPALNAASGTQTTLYCYDALNRVTYQYTYNGSITCTNPPSFYDSVFAYDGTLISGSQFSGTTFTNAKGHLTDAQERAWTTLMSERVPYSFDSMGRTQYELHSPYSPSPSTYTLSTTYDLAGDVVNSGNTATNITLTNTYDAAARLTSIASNLTSSGGITYPGNLYSVSSYGPVGLTQATYAGDPNSTGFFNLFRYYDNRGRVRDNEVYPGSTSTTGFGTATVTITGGPATGTGSVSIQAGTETSSATYTAGLSAAQIANALATGFNENTSTAVTAVTASAVSNATANSSGQGACTNGSVPNTSTPCAVVALKAIEVGVYGDVALTLGGSGTSFTTAESGLALTGGVGTPQGPGYAYVYTLSYDRVGNIASSNDAYNGSWNYSYDPLNRLTKESATGYETPGFVTTAGKVNYQCWNYDNFGNRTFELDSSSTCPTSPLTQATSTHFASYNVSNQITGSDTEVNGPIYDAAGNVIQDALNNYLYDAKGRLCAVENLLTTSATEYVYDADGNRVAKGNWTGISWPTAGNTWAANAVPNCSTPTTANGFTLTAVYLRGAGGTQDLEIDSAQGSTPAGWRQNVFADGGLLATYQQSGTSAPALYFDFNDWLGTKRLVVNAAGQAVNYWGSDPFGDYLTPHVTTDPSDLHFTGKERDTESGNDYFGARYYASSMGRFMSPDWAVKARPVPYAKLDNPQSLNLYAYVGNNPLSRIDPDGHYMCNGSKDQCAQIQAALNLAKAAVKDLRADSKQGKAIQKVIDLYGDAGKKNGVNVSFATMKPGQLGDAGIGKDGSINIRFDLKQINAFGSKSPQPGASMFGERVQTVVHEGTHGVDERNWGHTPQTPQQEDWTEHNAYRNGSYAVTGLGWFSASGLYSPGMSAKDREAAIDVEAQRSDDAWAGKP